MRRITLFLLGIIGLGLAPAARAQDSVSLERSLVRAAPSVLKHCQDAGYQNVGVLKFLVHKAGVDKLSDSAGTLNRTIARQLEMGMILSNNAAKPIGIIDNASDVAAKTPGANHLTKEGRLKLFEPTYPLAWGKDQVKADAFITGMVSVSADLKNLTIKLFAFDAKNNKLDPVGKDLTALNDPRKLSEMGESFSTRGAFDDGTVENKDTAKKETEVIEKAAQVKENAAPNPAKDDKAPIKLTVLYDGKPIPFELKDGKAFIPEPNEGQKVAFQMQQGAKAKMACVLKVNGENTLFRQKLPDLQCRKWILEGGSNVQVNGFQLDNDTSETFKVLSKAESKAREIDYGNDVGTITLTVFQEQKGKPAKGDLSDETQQTKAVEKAALPEKKADNFNALTAQLLDDANRGLIAEGGEKKGNKVEIVKFTPDPTPVMSLTVVYYKK